MDKKKNKILDLLIAVVVILLIIVVLFIVVKYYNRYINEKEIETKVNNIYNEISIYGTDDINYSLDTEYKGYSVYGILKIQTLDICYPILESLEDNALKISVIKFFESYNDNGYSNITIAGHNNYDNTMFGKLKQLQKGDIIEIVGKDTKLKQFEVYSMYITDPMDTDYTKIDKNSNINELTLVTCKNGNAKRYIVKAKECKL